MPPKQDPTGPDRPDSREVVDNTPFPNPDLYFKVFDSERDEPETKYREDVNKLYDRWLKKHGRKWPENGLNTDDLVWLYNEAYADQEAEDIAKAAEWTAGTEAPPLHRGGASRRRRGGADGGPADAGAEGAAAGGAVGRPRSAEEAAEAAERRLRRRKWVTGEREDIPGELMEASSDALDAAIKGLPKDPKARAAALSRAKDELDAATWVTDEFESSDYERGNLEAVHDMYLWDREGKTTIMPDEPPKEEQGERSDDWDDFYGAVHPRYAESDDLRDALWATDEFESDEDNTESEWEPEYVGMGLGLKHEDPLNPQYSLRHSTHPLAPFPGEPLKWSSYVYDDGTTYEGLSRDAIAHGMGVMVFGNGTGGGLHLRDVRRGDKYEGEFQVGYAHGLGQFTSPTTGEVYIGEWFAGQRHGCGVKVDMGPFYYLLERGEDPVTAYRRTYEKIMRNIEFRTWYRNQPLGENNEAEAVLYTVREDFDSPWTTVARNLTHEQKLREWRSMGPNDKVLSRMVDILEQTHKPRDDWDKMEGSGSRTHLRSAGALDAESSDSEDSIELMVGHTTEGGYGYGWKDDSGDSDLYPFDDALASKLANEVLDDKIEEEEDRQAILGKDILNPTTGLTLVDYLEGREGRHNEQLFKTFGIQDGGDTYLELDSEDLARLKEGPKLDMWTEDRLLKHLRASNALEAEEDGLPVAPDRNWAAEHTDTRFETESDMMELCDLAETLGTIDEVEEIVSRARMWRWKPYGEVTLRFAQDAQGKPVELMQDPIHYPHGTKWMAPGPLGQVHPLPDDRAIRAEMARVANNYEVVHRMYNFDWDPTPGSPEWIVDQRIKRAEELQNRRLDRMRGAVAEAEAAEAAAAAAAAAAGGKQEAAVLAEASAAAAAPPPPPPFASMLFGGGVSRTPQSIGRASRAVLNTLSRAARRAPPLSSGRPRVTRPAARGQQQQQKQQQQRQQ